MEMMLNPGAAKGHATKSVARHLPTAARLLMGLVFFVFGLNAMPVS